ncbi:MAG: hypothetical protein [Cotesia congregata filamentous virus 2]
MSTMNNTNNNIIDFLYDSEYGFASYFLNLQRTEKLNCWALQNSIIYAQHIVNYYDNHFIKPFIMTTKNNNANVTINNKYDMLSSEIILNHIIDLKKKIDLKYTKKFQVSLVDFMSLKCFIYFLLKYNPPSHIFNSQYQLNNYILVINEHLANLRYNVDLNINIDFENYLNTIEYRLYQTSIYVLPNKKHILTMFTSLQENGFEMEDIKIIGNNEYTIMSLLNDSMFLFFSTPNMNSISKMAYYKPGGYILGTVKSPEMTNNYNEKDCTIHNTNHSNTTINTKINAISKNEFCLQLYVLVMVKDVTNRMANNNDDRKKLTLEQLKKLNLILNSNNPELYLYTASHYLSYDFNVNILLGKISTIKYYKSFSTLNDTLFNAVKDSYNHFKLFKNSSSNIFFYIKYPIYQNKWNNKHVEIFLNHHSIDLNNAIIQWGFFVDDALCELNLSNLIDKQVFYNIIVNNYQHNRKTTWVMQINDKLHIMLIESSPCDNITCNSNKPILSLHLNNSLQLYNESSPIACIGFNNSNNNTNMLFDFFRLTPLSIYHKLFGIITFPNMKFTLPWNFDQYDDNLKNIHKHIRNLFCKDSDIFKFKDELKNCFKPTLISIYKEDVIFTLNNNIQVIKYWIKLKNTKITFYILHFQNNANSNINITKIFLSSLIQKIDNVLATKHCLSEINNSDVTALLEINKYLTTIYINID